MFNRKQTFNFQDALPLITMTASAVGMALKALSDWHRDKAIKEVQLESMRLHDRRVRAGVQEAPPPQLPAPVFSTPQPSSPVPSFQSMPYSPIPSFQPVPIPPFQPVPIPPFGQNRGR